ncbi:succinate dehydrogenase subunit 8, mitochondrial [Rutidosis leptorrhynchoides]
MIYRKWSLITGPAVMCGGVAVAALAVNFIFKQDPFAKPPEKKQGK